jgi:hypothetical protein
MRRAAEPACPSTLEPVPRRWQAIVAEIATSGCALLAMTGSGGHRSHPSPALRGAAERRRGKLDPGIQLPDMVARQRTPAGWEARLGKVPYDGHSGDAPGGGSPSVANLFARGEFALRRSD